MKTIHKISVVRKTILSLLLVLMTCMTYAQQQSQFTQFMDAGMLFNPGMAGSAERLRASFLGRWQWVGFEGSPTTHMALVEGAIPNRNIGLGLILTNDEVAITKTTSLRLNYAYKLQVADKGILSMGLSGSLINHRINFSDLYVVDPDNTFSDNASTVKPNFGAGLNFRSDRLSVGVAVPEIINNKLEEDGIELFSQTRHVYVSGGYRFTLNAMIDIQTNALVRMVSGSPLAADLNVMAWHNDRIGFGIGHRLDESLSAIVQVKATDKLLVGYGFDYITDDQLGNLANTSHEVLLTYSVPWTKFKRNKDADNDGVKDKEDECPNQAGPIDNNGCPLPDSDGDGIPDMNDQCPNAPGTIENGGCPDTDGDGIIDREDGCPDVAGTNANNGCPDTDGDGVLDHLDQCPEIAGLAKFSGCPDTDNDGIRDSEDQCPNEAGLASNDGCPGLSEETKLVLAQALEGVQFESSKDVLKTSSYDVLEKVVEIMKSNPDYRLKVSGYTDSSGRDDVNLRLSKQRANGVKTYLTEKGIDANRIDADGFGEASPIADNETREGRAKNRRVEFEILL